MMSIPRHAPIAPTALRRLAPGAGIDAHRHDDHQIAYAATGVLAVTTDRGHWIAPATRAIWIPAGTVHEHRAYGPTELHLVGLPVDTDLRRAVDDAGENPVGLEAILAVGPVGLDAPAVLAVGPLLRELIIAYTADPADDSVARSRIRGVLLDQLRQSPQQPIRLPVATDSRLAAVCEILYADPADGRGLAQLGSQVGAAERTLSRLFRQEFAMTFPQWRTQLRLHHALILLADGEPVTTVAYRCGWSSPSAFIDVFRRTFGQTPGRQF